MSEVGDEPEKFSGLGEVVRPFSFEDGGLSADREFAGLDEDFSSNPSDDDTVLLAPKRDFSPAAMARDEGAEADIESPFAKPSSKTVSELMSPVRQHDGDSDISQHVFEAKAPNPDLGPVVRMPGQRKDPPPLMPPAPSPIAEAPSDKPPVELYLPNSPEVLPLDNPALIRPRPVRPTLAQPAAAEAKTPPPGPRRRPVGVGGTGGLTIEDEPSSEPVTLQTSLQHLPPASDFSFGEAEAFPNRRKIDALQPKTNPIAAGPPPPSLPSRTIRALARAGRALLGGLGTAWTVYFNGCQALVRGLGIVWAVYSRWCLALANGSLTAWTLYSRGCQALQARLSQAAGRTLVQGRSLARRSGSALVHLGRRGAQGSRTSGIHAWKAAKSAGLPALGLMKTAPLAACKGLADVINLVIDQVIAFARRMLAWGANAVASTRKMAERRRVVGEQKRQEAAEAAKAAKAAEVARAAETLKAQARAVASPPKASSRPLPASKASEPKVVDTSATISPVSTKPSPAMSSDAKKVVGEPTSVDAFLAALKTRPFFGLGPRRLALAGLAAASIAFLILGIAWNPTTVPGNTALTFPIPERPVIGVIPPKGAESVTENIETTAASTVSTSDTVSTFDAVPELRDPIADMLAYVGELAANPPAASSISPVLARAGAEEGLSQFVRAAEVVGLKELLEPGERYTIFVPNDEAFAKLASGEFESLLEPTGHERLLTLLSHHVLPGQLKFDDFQGGVHEYTSLAGETLSIDAAEVVRVGGASMVEADLQTNNGVLHVIDQVLPFVTP